MPYVLLLCVLVSASADEIRLRNERIPTPEKAPKAMAAAKAAEAPHTGLFLIQFTGPSKPEWLDQLRGLGVSPVHYVPDNAFIARASGVKLKEIEELPFVRWTGPFKPEHKLHSRVAKQKQAAGDLEVSILLAPDATAQQLAGARGSMKRIGSQASLKLGHVWKGAVTANQLAKLAESDAVLWVEAAPKMKLVDETSSKIVGGDSGGHATVTQSLGYDGSGVTVSVADSGLHVGTTNGMHPDLFGRVDALFHYGDLEDASDEHGHGTHCAGIIAGNGATGELDDYGALWGLGVAPGVHIVAQRLFDGEGNYYAPPSFQALTTDAMNAGAEIGSNSWGDDTQGRYDISAAEFDALVRDGNASIAGDQPYILEFSAGNAGPGMQTIGSPAVAKNVIATGASQNERFDYFIYAEGRDAMADFSSRGPAEDGRIKPDLVAPGTWIASLRSPLGNDEFAWADISSYYMFQGGTSQAGPHASGAAAVFVQYFRETHTNATPSPALVKAALINSATDMDDSVETSPTPNMDEGWGRIDLESLIDSIRTYDYVDQSVKLATGQQFERRIVVSDSSEPLVVTLAYTDVPGFPGALIALVNDLDLEVIAPDGQIYRGNQFNEGESTPGAPGRDEINNVEGVYISEPRVGEYIVRVKARNVVFYNGSSEQDFALVTSALMPAPNEAIVLLDRPAYTAPSQINVRLIDLDRGTTPTVNVTLKSATEPAGFNLTLKLAQYAGTYTGTVATLTGPSANDGILQIAHGDWIRAEYFDASANITRVGAAVGDLLPPIISGVAGMTALGQSLITWTTDEPSISIVRYNTNSTLSRSATNLAYVTQHAVELTNLIVGRTYQFSVTSTDVAGNMAINNNGGANFTFVPQPAPTVLLVNAFHEDPDPETPALPLSTYTNALRDAGVSFDVLNVTSAANSPTLARMLPYPVVIWRINDSYNIQSDTLSSQQQGVITNYLNAGGSFFMASMEILSRIGSVPFRTNILHVARFAPNELIFEPDPNADEDHTVEVLDGVSKNPIGTNVFVNLDYSLHPSVDFGEFIFGPDFSDTFGLKRSASPIFIEPSSGEPCAMSYPRPGNEAPGRVVFFAFPFDAIPESGAAPNTRAAIMRRIIQFLVPGIDGYATIALDRDSYTTPDNVIVEVADSDLAGLGTVQIDCYTSSVTNRVPVTLTETGRRGLFRGRATTAPMNASPGPGILRASNGATIHATYRDVSSSLTLEAAAVIDLNVPAISGTVITPDYQEATVSWDTTELADALVEYGESPFLGRTVYDEDLDFSHELTLPQLTPDSLYYMRITSRDAAGNTVVDDNNGQLYTFRTLRPLDPPFTDNFDGPASNWGVFDGDESQTSWTLGVPDNGVETAAASAPNAWGSSLYGDIADYIDAFLISPAIRLTGGNTATLRFQTSYDFSEKTGLDLLEYGELLVFTNHTDYATVATFEDVSGGWYEEEIDLSPFVGSVVYLVWHHGLFAFDSAPRPGWLIDDVSLEMSDTPHGTLLVSNNLSQASFTISGPISVSAQGTSYANTNAPLGTYTITFSPVPYFVTPAAQSNSVAANGTMLFTGNYTFSDSNGNGISDAWETSYFGSVSPTRTQFTDTDADGMTDRAEFLAGTNPTNQASVLRFTTPVTQNIGVTRFDWPTVPGRSYRVLGSANLSGWTAAQDWARANGPILSYTVPSTNGLKFFRLEVKP